MLNIFKVFLYLKYLKYIRVFYILAVYHLILYQKRLKIYL